MMQGPRNAPSGAAGTTGGVVAVRIGAGGTRGMVRVSGSLDEATTAAITSALMQLLEHDIGEVWLDLRDVRRGAPLALAALLSWRRRAVRVGVRIVLVAEDGPVLQLLAAAGMRDSFAVVSRLPDDPAEPAPDAERALAHPAVQAAAHRVLARRASGADRPLVPVPAESRAAVSPTRTAILPGDPELAEGVPADQLGAAHRELTAPIAVVQRGRWTQGAEWLPGPNAVVLLLLDALIVRRVGHVGGFGAELLGPGDVLRADRHPGEDATPGFTTTLTVIQSGRLAVLDGLFWERLRDHPAVATNILGRAMARSHALTVAMAIAHYPRIERRVHETLWLLAQRWGRVSPEGVHLRLPLTHAIIADLTASRRPSVTLALAQLERAGRLIRRPADWVLLGDWPEPLPVPEPADPARWTER